jgi:hypothetical protein
VGNDGGPPVEFRYGTQVDGEGQHHLLSFAQSQVGRFNKHTCGAQVDGFTQLPAATRNRNVDNGSSSMPRMQAAFHFNQPRVILLVVRRDGAIMPSSGPTPWSAST